MVVARKLGPQEFGVYALLLAMVEMLAVASGSGYADYLTREAAKDARLGWGLASQLAWLRLGSTVPLAAIAVAILWVLGYSLFVLVAVAWLAASLAPRSVSEAVQGVLRGIGRYGAYLTIEVAFDLTLLGGAAALSMRGGGLSVVVATEVIAAVTAAIVAAVFFRMFATKERAKVGLRELLAKSAVFNVYYFVSNLYDRFDIVMLSKLAGDYATGIYSAAYRPLGTIQLVPYGVLYSILPALSRAAQAERARLERAMGLLLSAAFVVVLVTMVYASPVVTFLFGGRYTESAVALKILIWAVILRYVNYALNLRLLAGGHERVFVTTSVVCLSVNLIANLILIPLYSWKAAAAVTILTEFVLLVQNVYWLRRTVGGVPKPFGWVKTSLVFGGLVVVWFAGAKLTSPLVIGSVCLLIFLGYLYRTGMLGEFAATWSAQRRAGGFSS
jgi:O-antigen/teichoic acid export membrane protein